MNTNIIIYHSPKKSLFAKQHRLPGSVSRLVHELRNPLCNIYLACDMLDLTGLDEVQRICLDIITRGSIRVNDLIESILKADEIPDEKHKLYPLRQLLEEVLVTVEERILIKRVQIERNYTATEDEVLVDVDKMKLALTDIIINAIEAMPSENGELKLATRSTSEANSIAIQNNGKGISKVDMERMFEPHLTNGRDGIGLGMSATVDILKANHVSVNIRSGEDTGTSFILSFDKDKNGR